MIYYLPNITGHKFRDLVLFVGLMPNTAHKNVKATTLTNSLTLCRTWAREMPKLWDNFNEAAIMGTGKAGTEKHMIRNG